MLVADVVRRAFEMDVDPAAAIEAIPFALGHLITTLFFGPKPR